MLFTARRRSSRALLGQLDVKLLERKLSRIESDGTLNQVQRQGQGQGQGSDTEAEGDKEKVGKTDVVCMSKYCDFHYANLFFFSFHYQILKSSNVRSVRFSQVTRKIVVSESWNTSKTVRKSHF